MPRLSIPISILLVVMAVGVVSTPGLCLWLQWLKVSSLVVLCFVLSFNGEPIVLGVKVEVEMGSRLRLCSCVHGQDLGRN